LGTPSGNDNGSVPLPSSGACGVLLLGLIFGIRKWNASRAI
jgi:hypothetical protein